MPLRQQIRDLYAVEIIAEFQSYGFHVIGQERDNENWHSQSARAAFYEQHRLDRASACILISESTFARFLTEGRPENNLDDSAPAGWIHFHPADDAPYDDETIGAKMAQRLRDGRSVTLTAHTAQILKRRLIKEPAAYCTWPLRARLSACVQRAIRSGRPSMIALRHNGARAKLRHLRIAQVGEHFVPR